MFGILSKDQKHILEGDGLRLRLPRKSDYVPWQSVRAASRQFLAPFEPSWSDLDLTKHAFEERVRHSRREARRGSEFSFLLFDTSASKEFLIGGLTLSNVRYRAARHANLGYWMGVQYAGKGHMSQGVGLSLPFVFEYLNLRRLHAACLPHNLPSRRVLENNGFIEEGFAEQYLQIDGQWRDHVLYGLSQHRFSTIIPQLKGKHAKSCDKR